MAKLLEVTTAAILVGGKGERLRSVVHDRPKVLAPVAGRPFLAYLLDQLCEAGMQKVVLCTGYLAEQVEQAFGPRYGTLELLYSREDEPLDTGGALRLALRQFDCESLLVLNGDSYCDLDFSALLDWYEQKQCRATIVLAHLNDIRRFGSVRWLSDGTIIEFEEKGQQGIGWINAGVYIVPRQILAEISASSPVSLERECFPNLVQKHLLTAFPGGRRFIDIGTPESYCEAEDFFTVENQKQSRGDMTVLPHSVDTESQQISTDSAVSDLSEASKMIEKIIKASRSGHQNGKNGNKSSSAVATLPNREIVEQDLHRKIREYLYASAEALSRTADDCAEAIARAAHMIATSLSDGGKLLICGNGGSASQSHHMAAEFVSTLNKHVRRPALAAISLATDTSILTAISNDFGYSEVFQRQVEALGRPGDALLLISTSGNSKNAVRAAEQAKQQGIVTIALVGPNACALASAADILISVPSDDTQHIQEVHLAIEHLLSMLVEQEVLNGGQK